MTATMNKPKYKDRIRRGGNAKDRRKYRRAMGLPPVGEIRERAMRQPTLEELHPVDAERRLRSVDYGKSYNGVRGVVVSHEDGKVQLKVRKRKSPLVVDPQHLEAV